MFTFSPEVAMNGSLIICDNSCVHYGLKKKVMIIISLMEYLGDIKSLATDYYKKVPEKSIE